MNSAYVSKLISSSKLNGLWARGWWDAYWGRRERPVNSWWCFDLSFLGGYSVVLDIGWHQLYVLALLRCILSSCPVIATEDKLWPVGIVSHGGFPFLPCCEKISQAQRNTWFTTLLPLKPLSRDLTVGCEPGSKRTLSLYTWFSVSLESGEDTLAKIQCLQNWVAECFSHGGGLGWMGEEEGYGPKSKANWILEATVHGSGNAVILTC